jgi:protein SCO1/2
MKRVLAVFLIFVIGVAVIIYINYDFMNQKKLPILSPCDVNPELYDSSLYRNCIGHKITDFQLTDQLNRKVGIEILKNKIAVVDFFFVSCPSICPKMTNNLQKIHTRFQQNKNIIILSHTVWPEMDSVNVLYDYAEKYGVNHESWRFLTGDKKELYRLARKNYLVAPDINDPNYKHGSSADFIHTENIVLVDQKQRIRGFYDGTSTQSIEELSDDIILLQKN